MGECLVQDNSDKKLFVGPIDSPPTKGELSLLLLPICALSSRCPQDNTSLSWGSDAAITDQNNYTGPHFCRHLGIKSQQCKGREVSGQRSW